MAGVNMSDPDGVRKHGDGFHKKSEHVVSITDRLNNMQLNGSTMGSLWQDEAEQVSSGYSLAQTPWRGHATNHKNFGDNLHFAANTYQGTDETHADSIKNTDVPDGKL